MIMQISLLQFTLFNRKVRLAVYYKHGFGFRGRWTRIARVVYSPAVRLEVYSICEKAGVSDLKRKRKTLYFVPAELVLVFLFYSSSGH